MFLDADLRDFTSSYVVGLLGPLVLHPEISYVKATYDRPVATTPGVAPAGGGRVTELLARPLLNAWWPQLSGFVQPLSGEYAGRRAVLERVPFVAGYGVEVGLLIDLLRARRPRRVGAGGPRAPRPPSPTRPVARSHERRAAAGDGAAAAPGAPRPRAELDQYVRGPGGGYEVVPWLLPTTERPPVAAARREVDGPMRCPAGAEAPGRAPVDVAVTSDRRRLTDAAREAAAGPAAPRPGRPAARSS